MRGRWLSVRTYDASLAELIESARIPIAFETRTVMRVSSSGDGGFALSEEAIDSPVFKNYDALPGEDPVSWASRFARDTASLAQLVGP